MNSRLSKAEHIEADGGVLSFIGVMAIVGAVITISVLFLNDPQVSAFIRLMFK